VGRLRKKAAVSLRLGQPHPAGEGPGYVPGVGTHVSGLVTFHHSPRPVGILAQTFSFLAT
jgi:hypothetical protein